MQNILTIDTEELFHAEYVKKTKTDKLYRSPMNVPPILDMLDEHNAKATFFIVGELAEKHPVLLEKIAKKGHEVGFHSYDHEPLSKKTPVQFEKEIMAFNELLVSTIGEPSKGFRAPSFSLDNRTIWVIEVLERMKFHYDSSVFPVWTPLYGIPQAPQIPYRPSKRDLTKNDDSSRIWEFPLVTYPFLGFKIPASGGFYLRFLSRIVEAAIRKINKRGSPAVVYIHTWELDYETPKLDLGPYRSFITYHNIKKTSELFERLLRNFDFTSLAEYSKNSGMI